MLQVSNPSSEAERIVFEGISKGLEAARVNIAHAVFPNVIGAIAGWLFETPETRQAVREYCDQWDAKDKTERSQPPVPSVTPDVTGEVGANG